MKYYYLILTVLFSSNIFALPTQTCSPKAPLEGAISKAHIIYNQLKNIASSRASANEQIPRVFKVIVKHFDLRKILNSTIKPFGPSLKETIEKHGSEEYNQEKVLADVETLFATYAAIQLFSTIGLLDKSSHSLSADKASSSSMGRLTIIKVPHVIKIENQRSFNATFSFVLKPGESSCLLYDYSIDEISILKTLELRTQSLRKDARNAPDFLLKIALECKQVISHLGEQEQKAIQKLSAWLRKAHKASSPSC